MTGPSLGFDTASRARRRRQGLMLLLTDEPIAAGSEIPSPTPLLDIAASSADPLTVVTALFRHILGREADAEGLATWRTHLEHDVPVRTVARAMVSSPEFARLPRPHRDAVLQQLASWDATGWLAELGVGSSPVRPLAISEVAPGLLIQGPVAGLDEQVHELHRQFRATPG